MSRGKHGGRPESPRGEAERRALDDGLVPHGPGAAGVGKRPATRRRRRQKGSSASASPAASSGGPSPAPPAAVAPATPSPPRSSATPATAKSSEPAAARPPPAPEPSRAVLAALETRCHEAWPDALVAMSPYTRLLPPIYCRSVADEKREGLLGSFAMIRMRDDRVVLSLRQLVELGLEAHVLAILAHEVGHYVHAPGSLYEHVRLLDRIRRCLPETVRSQAAVVSNLYTDLLLNDRLQRGCDIDVAGVYRALRSDRPGPLWSLYMRAYELLWRLPRGDLTPASELEVEADAELAARIVRLFRDRWLEGAGSFAKLIAPYLEQAKPDEQLVPAWLDTAAGAGGATVPDGLVDDDFDPDGVAHPALDGRIAGGTLETDDGAGAAGSGHQASGSGPGRSLRGDGRPDARKVQRGPQAYVDLMQAVGVALTPSQIVARYYRELAMPHVIPFPAQRIEHAGDPLPEGLDVWDAGSPFERIDWLESLLRSPLVVPGVTTVERTFGVTEGGDPELRPPDLYVGIDCSGSMGNPAHQLAYPVIAGVVLTLSALRAGARVMACLSGEWLGKGQFLETSGFVRGEAELLGVLTSYLGTGCSFGLPRLQRTFVEAPRRTRPAHVLVVSDSDLFGEIDRTKDGWQTARLAVEKAGGGATAVLRLANVTHHEPWLAKLRAVGFDTHVVTSEQELVAFARAFARRTFAFDEAPSRPAPRPAAKG